jgi:hypothetical protein
MILSNLILRKVIVLTHNVYIYEYALCYKPLIRSGYYMLNFGIRYPGHAVASLVEPLYYEPEGSGFDFRGGHWIFQLT